MPIVCQILFSWKKTNKKTQQQKKTKQKKKKKNYTNLSSAE